MSQLSQPGRVDAQLKKTGGPKSPPPRQPAGAPAAGRGYGERGNAGRGPQRGGRDGRRSGPGGRGPAGEGRFQDQPSVSHATPSAPPPTDSHIDWPTVGGGKAGSQKPAPPQAAKPSASVPGGSSQQAAAPPPSASAPALANGPGAPPAKGPVSSSGQPLSYAKAATPQGAAPPSEKAPSVGNKATGGGPKKEAAAEKTIKEPASPTPPANGNAGRDSQGTTPPFQFGSVSPSLAYPKPNNFPARTSSAPPSLEEQMRNRQHLDHLAAHQPQIPSKARFESAAGKGSQPSAAQAQVYPSSKAKLDSPLSPVLEPTTQPPTTPPQLQLSDLPPQGAIAPTGWGGGNTAPAASFPSPGSTFTPPTEAPRTQTASNTSQQFTPRTQVGGASQAGSHPPSGRPQQQQTYQFGSQGYGPSVLGANHLGQMPAVQYGSQSPVQPSGQSTPAVAIAPRQSKAIKIINPSTKEEVKLSDAKDKKEGKPPTAPPPSLPSGGVPTPGQAAPQTRSSPPMQPQQPPQQQRPPPVVYAQQNHGQQQVFFPQMQGFSQPQSPYNNYGQRPSGPPQGVQNQGQGGPPFAYQQQPQHPGAMQRSYMQHPGGMVQQQNKPPGSGPEGQGGPQMMGQMQMQQPGGQMMRPPGPQMQQPGPNGRPRQEDQHGFVQGSPPNVMFGYNQVSNFGGDAPQTGPMVPSMSTIGFAGPNIRPQMGGPAGWGPRPPPQMLNQQQGRGIPQGGAPVRLSTVQAPGPMDKQRQQEGRPGSAGQGSNKERKKRDKDQQRPIPQGVLPNLSAPQQPRPPQVTAPAPGGQTPSQSKGEEAESPVGEKKPVSVTHPGGQTHPIVAVPPQGGNVSGGLSPTAVVTAPPAPQEAKQAAGEAALRQGRPAQLGSQVQVRELTHQKSGKFRDPSPAGSGGRSMQSPRNNKGGDSPRQKDQKPTQVFRPKVDQPNVAAAKAAAAAKESAQTDPESKANVEAPKVDAAPKREESKAPSKEADTPTEETAPSKETFAQKAAKVKPAAQAAPAKPAVRSEGTPVSQAGPAEVKAKAGDVKADDAKVKAAEERAKEEKRRAEAEAKAKADTEAKAKAEAEQKAKVEREAKANAEKEVKELEAKRTAEAEAKAKAEAEAKAKAEAETKARAEAERKAEAERRAEADRKAEAERKAKAEAEAKLKAEADAKAKAEAEAKAKADAEKKAEAERKAKAEAEKKAKAEEEAGRRKEEERKRAEEAAERKRKEDEKRKEEEQRKAKAEAEAKAKMEAEAKAAEERAKKEAEGKRREEDERKRAEEEKRKADVAAKAKAEADAKAKAEAEAERNSEAELKKRAEADPEKEQAKPPAGGEAMPAVAAVGVAAAVTGAALAETALADEKSKPASEKERPTSPGTAVKEVESAASKKKKRKEALSKADAAGDSKNLLDAFTTKKPDEPQKAADSFVTPKKGAKEQPSVSKVEIDDWEDAADMPTPKPPRGGSSLQRPSTPADKRYSRDYLLTFKEDHAGWPAELELLSGNKVLFKQPDMPKPRTPTGKRGGKGPPEDDKWSQRGPDARVDSPGRGGLLPGNFRPGGPGPSLGGRGMRPGQPGPGIRGPGGQFVPPGVPPAMLGMQGPNQNGIDANRWGKKPMEPVAPKQPLPAIHKTQNRFVVGKPTDEETAKIKKVKGILNKLTPENFGKLFEQMIDVEINNATTLTMVIAQVFEKALLEPSFCELYAEFSKELQNAMPEFDEKDEEGRDIKVTFRRILLNKCQEEFERSNEQVDENSEERGEEGEEKEEKKKLTQEQIGEEKRKIRTRFLGNVRFIGELYKKGLLTEKIMHVCITKLLGGEEVPHEEDLEALCKLLSTIGGMVDHQKSKQHMDAYLKRMYDLSKDNSLSSRIRFMLLDVVEMRESGWRERRKKDGPKTIDQVHRDAAQESREKLAAASGGRPDMRRGGGGSARRGDFAPPPMRGGPGPIFPNPPQMRGGPMGRGPGDARLADRMDGPPRVLSARHDDGQLVLGPGGRGRPGFGPPVPMRSEAEDRFRGARDPRAGPPPPGDRFGERGGPDRFGDRGGPAGPPDRFAGPPDRREFERGASRDFEKRDRDEGPSRDRSPVVHQTDRGPPSRPSSASSDSTSRLGVAPREASTSRPATPQSPAKVSEGELERRTVGAFKEYIGLRDVNEVEAILESLDAASYHPKMISLWLTTSSEGKDNARGALIALVTALMHSDKKLVTREQLERGFNLFLNGLEEFVIDVPKAYEHTALFFSKFIAEGLLTLSTVGSLLKNGGETEGELVDLGGAYKVLVGVLKNLKEESGEEEVSKTFKGSGLDLKDFVGSDRDRDRLEKLLQDNGLTTLVG